MPSQLDIKSISSFLPAWMIFIHCYEKERSLQLPSTTNKNLSLTCLVFFPMSQPSWPVWSLLCTDNSLSKSFGAEWASPARQVQAKDSSLEVTCQKLLQGYTVSGMVLICWVKAINISIHGSLEFFRGELQLRDVLLLCGTRKHNWETWRNNMGVRKEEIMVQIQHLLRRKNNGS